MTKLWNASLVTGVPSMDAQHQHLVRLIETFDTLCAQGQTRRALNDLLPELQRYIAHHFAEEETLMLQLGPDYTNHGAHLAQHALFIETITEMGTRRGHWGDLQAAIRIRTYLHDWLLHHIAHTDQDLALQVLGQLVSAER
ncbi:MAG: bacteriohemerythrin [Rhodoferax sp.]